MIEREVIQTVWVVMGNDYPAAVFSNEEAARAYCKKCAETNALERVLGNVGRIYYQTYPFLLDRAP